MRYIVLMAVAVLLFACDRDPYFGRKGGYTPGETYRHQSGLYPGMLITPAGA